MASKDTIAANIINPKYQWLANNTEPKDCASLCDIAANEAGTSGCCEHRVQGKQCVWTGANPYLAPEFREKDSQNAMDSRAVLCSSGSNDIS